MLKIRYRSGEDFLKHYQATFPTGGIFFPTRRKISAETPVTVEIRFPGLPNRVVLRGSVAWRRAGRHSVGLRAGWGIAFASEDATRRDFVLSVANGEMSQTTHPRRFRRLLVGTPARWRPKSVVSFNEGTLADIGPGGAFVRSEQRPELGEEVVLGITPPGGQTSIDVEGRVVWVRKDKDTGTIGFGVQFKVRDVGGLRRIREVVRRLGARI